MEVREPSAKYLAKPAYKQTEVGVIPEDWECSKIGAFIDLLTGFPFPSRGYSPSGVRLLRGSNIKRGTTDWGDDITEYWPSVSVDIRKYVLNVGDVVVAMDGSLVGRSFASLSETDIPSLLLQRVARIRSSWAVQDYLKAWICSRHFTDHCDVVKTTTAIPHISSADIRSFRVAIPPTCAEQQAIADALSDADTLIKSLEQLLTKKRRIKQGAMQELLTGQRRLPGFAGEWISVPLGELFQFKNGISKAKKFFGHGIPIVNYMDVFTTPTILCGNLQGRVCLTRDELRNFDVKKGDVLFTRTSETAAEVGMAAVIADDLVDTAFSGFVLRGRPKDERLCDEFKAYCLRAPYVRAQIVSKASYTTRALTNGRALSAVILHLPEVDEQTAIATVLSDMDAEIAALEAKLAKARRLKLGMMAELLTGRIRLV